ncbi:MAG: arginyltransferase [Alphaproteobacteria bacterium]|nr:arginyltransferase [Alphaproteobacteria bacterium]
MSIERRNFPQFFITAPTPCPYLPGKMERKVFTHLVGADARGLNTMLSQGGFRRSQNIAYRPACDACSACISTRVPVADFRLTDSFKRVMRKNADITSRVVKAQATSEHYSVFRGYIDTRHSEGGMADMSVIDFAAMVDDTVTDSQLIEFRLHRTSISVGQLVGAVLVDVMGDGLSLIYSFYEPSHEARSLGTLMVLDAIQRAKAMGLPYVYLGYYVQGSRKMEYKARFKPQERLSSEGWRRLD